MGDCFYCADAGLYYFGWASPTLPVNLFECSFFFNNSSMNLIYVLSCKASLSSG
jgi:hypothetical protein